MNLLKKWKVLGGRKCVYRRNCVKFLCVLNATWKRLIRAAINAPPFYQSAKATLLENAIPPTIPTTAAATISATTVLPSLPLITNVPSISSSSFVMCPMYIINSLWLLIDKNLCETVWLMIFYLLLSYSIYTT